MKLGLELALEPEQARVQALELQAQALVQALAQVAKLERLELRAQALVQALAQVAKLERLELRAQALAQVAKLERLELRAQSLVQVAELARLEPLAQVQLELEQRLQRSHQKPQLHPHRCKGPDHSQEPQLGLRQTQAHPKALDMTPRVLALELQVAVLALAPELEQVQGLAAQLAQKLEQPAQQKLLAQELELEPEPHVFLERLPLQQG